LNFLQYIGYFFVIFLIALFVGTFKQESVKAYNFLKDITYLFKPILGLVLGYQLCRKHIQNPLSLVVNTGLFIAIAHLAVVAYAFLFLHVGNINDLRLHAGYFSDFEVYAVIIVMFNKEFGLELSARKRKIALIVIGF